MNSREENLRIISFPEDQKGDFYEEARVKDISEKNTLTHILEAQRIPAKRDSSKSTPRHNLIRMVKIINKDKILTVCMVKDGNNIQRMVLKIYSRFNKGNLLDPKTVIEYSENI